jgi:hypothetical protein
MASKIHRYVTIIAVVFCSICRGAVAQEHYADNSVDNSNMCIESICIPAHQAGNARIVEELDTCLRKAFIDQERRICVLDFETNSQELSLAFSECWVDCRSVSEDSLKEAVGLKTKFLY